MARTSAPKRDFRAEKGAKRAPSESRCSKKNDSRSSLVRFFMKHGIWMGSKHEPKTDPQMASKMALKRHPENRHFEDLFWTHFGHLLGSFWGAFWASFGPPKMVHFGLHFWTPFWASFWTSFSRREWAQKWTPIGPKATPSRSAKGSPNRPKMEPKWAPNRPKNCSKGASWKSEPDSATLNPLTLTMSPRPED